MTIPLVDIWTSSVCVCVCVCVYIYIYTHTHTYIPSVYTAYMYFYTVYIHFYIMYLFLMQYIYNGISSIVFGMVHSDTTWVVLLHKHFGS